MNKTEKILLGLAAAAALVLSVGVVYSSAAPQQYRQTGTTRGMMGGGGPSGGMMGGPYSGGMMGGALTGGMMSASAYANGMMGGFGSMMSGMAQHMSALWNQTWSASRAGVGAYVAVVGYAFYPTNITIAKGTTVTWVNMDFVQHAVTSGSKGAPTGLFHSHELSHMQSFSYTFNTSGTYQYYCDIHPGMIGAVSVEG